MALNFSHRPIVSTHLSEENMVSPMRIANGYRVEGIPERNVDGCGNLCQLNRSDYFDYGRDTGDCCGSHERAHNDVIELLPSDPFGMGISTTVTAITAITGLFGDSSWYGRDGLGTNDGNHHLFAELNLSFQQFPGNTMFYHKTNLVGGIGGCTEEEINMRLYQGINEPASNMYDSLSFKVGSTSISGQQNGIQEASCSYSDGDEGSPHPAMEFVLGYLGVRDLLVSQMVCTSLRTMIRDESLIWRSIHIYQPLNEKITDDGLLQLTNMSKGTLQSLSLVKCPKITDEGVKCVLERNPHLTKLSVPGCTKLSIEGIVNSLKAFKTRNKNSKKNKGGLTHLRIGGLYNMTHVHFEELKSLLSTCDDIKQNTHKPHFYEGGNLYLSCEDNKSIDVEICPKCQNVRLVYDCPADSCRVKDDGNQICRGCFICIPRCAQCGRCINDSEYVETFCLELLCTDCWEQPSNYEEWRQDRKIVSSKFLTLLEPSGSRLDG